jgi:glucose-6-phosphate 1-dehydrogenase
VTAVLQKVPTALFGPIVEHLGAARLLRGGRVAVEKPFGHDLASARELNASLHRLLPESLPKVTGERLYQNMRLNLPNRRGG